MRAPRADRLPFRPGAMRRRVVALALLLVAGSAVACRGGARGGSADGLPPEAPTRVRMHRVPSVTLSTVEVGDAQRPLTVVVHGGPGLDHTYLRPWLDRLGDRHRLVYVDLRGHGRSTLPPSADGYTISAAAADLAALIADLTDNGIADVVAHDWGAEVALELAAQHPERVDRLVLVAPFWRPEQLAALPARTRHLLGETAWRRLRALSTPQGALRDPRSVVELFRRRGRLWWHHPPGEAVLARMGRDLRYSPAADEHFTADAQIWDGQSRARSVRARTLVVAGASDQAVEPEDARALADLLPHGDYAEVSAAGHCPFIEQPERFHTLLRAFFGGQGRP
jgi:proline iminopeptidase